MEAARRGDLAGLTVLFERYHPQLIGFFRNMRCDPALAEDMAQETFLRIARYSATYRSGSPFRAWMFRIARNTLNTQLRREVSRQEALHEVAELPTDEMMQFEPETRDTVENGERRRLLRTALDRLPHEKRELIVLCRFEEMPQSEVAEAIGCSVGAVRVRLFRALQDLKEVFLKLEGEITT